MNLTSLLARLLMIVLVALVPVLAFQIHTEIDARQVRQQLMEDEALRLLQIVSAEQQRIVGGAEQVLDMMAASPTVQDTVPQDCRRMLVNLLKALPRYSNASVIGLDGTLVCSALSVDSHINVSDRPWFQKALETGRFAVGDYVIGRGSGLPTVQMGKPFHNRDGAVSGVVQVSLSLEWLAQEIESLKLPPRSIVTFADRNGTFLARHPGHMRYVGQPIPAQSRFLLDGNTIQVFRAPRSLDNDRPIIVAVLPPGATPYGLEASIALDEETTFASVTQADRTGLMLIVTGAVLALGLTAVLGIRLIRRPFRQLLGVAEHWGNGELGIRTGLSRGGGEFGRLAAVFEDMVSTLQARETALRLLSTDLEARVQEEVAAREAAQARAAQAERMQALGQLAGGIAHDFNNVLQAASGALTLIQRRTGDEASIRRFAQIGIQAIDRGASVTRRLLAVGRRDELRAEAVDLAALLSSLHEILTYTLGVEIDVRIELSDDLPPIVADKGQLETVLINLATNARDAMPQGGSIVFSAMQEVVRAGEPGHPAGLSMGHYVRIAVTDTGSGMDAATLARAREPFFTTKQVGSGTGLGLPMAYGFAEQSGGGLTIESRPGHGTTAILWLPKTETSLTAQPAAERDEPLDEHSARILLVDDEDVILKVLAKYLQDSGYQAVTAANGADALDMLAAGETVDALVTDLSMPGMDGIAVIRAVRERFPDMPAVLLTGYAKDAAALVSSSGLSDRISLLRKPISDVQLLDQLGAMLAR